MATTKLADVIVPEVFNPYVIELSAELSAFWKSGIVGSVAGVVFPSNGGTTTNMPFWQDLEGDDEVLDDNDDLSINKIETENDAATIIMRGKAFGGTDLAAALAGSDPLAAIGTLIGGWWSRRLQAALISTLGGVFGAASMATNVFDISALSGDAAKFDAESFIDACGKLGDAEGKLVSMAIHSDTERKMRKLDLIDYLMDSEGKPTIPSYQGKRLVVDDGMAVTGSGADRVYDSVLFGSGAIGYSEGSPKVPSEIGRLPLTGGGQDFIVNRRHLVLHPRGVRWIGTPAKASVSNSELATATNWQRVYSTKNVRMVMMRHKL